MRSAMMSSLGMIGGWMAVWAAPMALRWSAGGVAAFAGDEALLETDRFDQADLGEAGLGEPLGELLVGEAQALARCWPSSSCP